MTSTIASPKKRRLSNPSPGEDGRRVLINEPSKKVKSESAAVHGGGAASTSTTGNSGVSASAKQESQATTLPSKDALQKTPPLKIVSQANTTNTPTTSVADPTPASPTKPRHQSSLPQPRQQQSATNINYPDLMIRLAKKEEEVQTLLGELQTLSQTLTPDFAFDPSLRKKILDPAINALFRTMKKELEDKEKIIEDLERELEGIGFTPNSITGKKLVAKLRALQQENEELGRQLRQGRVEQYEIEIALQRKIIEELKSKSEESDAQLVLMDEENERLQDIVFQLQAKLEKYQDKFGGLNTDNNSNAETLNLSGEPDIIHTSGVDE